MDSRRHNKRTPLNFLSSSDVQSGYAGCHDRALCRTATNGNTKGDGCGAYLGLDLAPIRPGNHQIGSVLAWKLYRNLLYSLAVGLEWVRSDLANEPSKIYNIIWEIQDYG